MPRFYVDECLPPGVADAINTKRGYRAVHAARDLGFAGRDDDFHIAESKRRKMILLTSNHREFKKGFDYLKGHPGMVVINTGTKINPGDYGDALYAIVKIFQFVALYAKPPRRNDLFERRLVISKEAAYIDDIDGTRLNVVPRPESYEWIPAPQMQKHQTQEDTHIP